MIGILTSTLDNINANKNTALLLLDLKKAFDTVNHDILSNKMNHYGIRGIANKLFASFLANRKQFFLSKQKTINLTTGTSNAVFLKAQFLVVCSIHYRSIT